MDRFGRRIGTGGGDELLLMSTQSTERADCGMRNVECYGAHTVIHMYYEIDELLIRVLMTLASTVDIMRVKEKRGGGVIGR